MQLSQLIQRFRTLANDKVEPYFNDDESVIDWLNDAVQEACIRGRLLHESQNPNVCRIAITAGVSHYPLHASLYELSRIWFEQDQGLTGSHLALMSPESLDHTYNENWQKLMGFPRFVIQDDTTIRLVPMPNANGELHLEGYRLPIQIMQLDSDVPEINVIHHVHLIQWVLHKAFSVPDAEFFDMNRSAMAEQEFSAYFGDRPDSDVRRITREDVPHSVVPFMP